MRAIKFRAWDGFEMIYFFCLSATGVIFLLTDPLGFKRTTPTRVFQTDSNYILMQYTGLKDSKGVEIYEGDIVEYYRKTYSNIGEVVYSNNHASYQISTTNKYMVPIRIGFSGLYGENDEILVKIIGNLYENPELLPKPGKE